MFLGKKERESFEKEFHDKKKLTKPIKTVEEKWKLLPAFLRTRGLQKHQISSFNYLVLHDMKKILDANRVVRPESESQYFWEYTDIRVEKPTKYQDMRSYDIFPQQCRLRDLTYSAEIRVDVRYTKGRKLITKKNIAIGRIPIMLQSCKCHLDGKTPEDLAKMGECPLDPGGYFVIRGVEKVVLIQEQMSKNRIFVDRDKSKNIRSACTSWTAELKSRTDVMYKKGKFYLHHNIFSEDIPIIVVFRAMGIESDLEILQLIGGEKKYLDAIIPSLQECDLLNIFTKDVALRYIGRKIKSSKKKRHMYGTILTDEDQGREQLARVVLCHLPVVKYNFKMKVVFISMMLRRMIDAIHEPELYVDDKDYYGNKRLELSGGLLSLLFEDLFKSYNVDLRRMADSELSKKTRAADFDITHLMEGSTKITRGMESTIKSGNWVIRRFHMDRAGVTQVLSRLSFLACISHMTRIDSQFEKTRKISGPRALQPSQWGMLCPSDTPEGQSCGLIKNLALLAHITTEVEPVPIVRICYDLGVEDIEFLGGEEIFGVGTYVVFVNGLVIGVLTNPDVFIKKFKKCRRMGKMNEFISIYKSKLHRHVLICCEGGRLCRPLIIVEKGASKVQRVHLKEMEEGIKKFDDFVSEGLVEYLDVNEENNSRIACDETQINKETTHLEIEPFSILGVCVGLIPYPHHNQSPRNTYQCAMGKQAMGTLAYNQFDRIDTLLYLLVYPQKPMVKTKVMDILGFEKTPAGQNAIIAVMSYSGYDIEDALLLNKASLDRGFGRCIVLKKYVATFQKYPNQAKDRFSGIDIKQSGMKSSVRKKFYEKYSKIDKDGIVCEGERVDPGQLLVNKYVPTITDGMVTEQKIPYKEQSLKYKNMKPGYVSRVIISSSDQHDTIVKVLMRDTRTPQLGDKFSSRHGQKGVCGLIVPQEDLPFNEEGICPDLIMNPHGFPSRMTVAKMIELINGKSKLLTKIIDDNDTKKRKGSNRKSEGKLGYGTAFGGDKIKDICSTLVEYGYSYSGKDFLTSGITGSGLQAYIFQGPVYYQKLKHMVLDKVHARARGPKAGLTRQPTVGRSRDGGFRLGEMERDCLVGYGAAHLLIERFMDSSDKVPVDVCSVCGFLGYKGYCQYCKSSQNVHRIFMPYACKLLFQELLSMNIFPKLELE